MRLLLCGGGTAGHINPAIAIAEEVMRIDPTAEILFVGREGGSENEAIKKEGFRLKTIKIQGLRRSLSIKNIKSIYLAIKAKRDATKIIKDFRPDVILGTGGYVCWPVISAGQKLKIPTTLHESNVIPGLTTKLLAEKCNIIFLNSDDTKKQLSEKIRTLTTGNPVRRDFKKISRAEARKIYGIKNNEKLILSFGGSIGAEKMNRVIMDVINNYSIQAQGIKHIHATGKRYYSENEAKKINDGKGDCKILPYIDDMPTALRAADVVISRCGAMTLSEIEAVGVASILIPSPNVTDNHQFKNALRLSKRGKAIIIEEKNLSSELLIKELKVIINSKLAGYNKAEIINSILQPDSAKIITKELFLLKNGNKKAVF